MKCKDCPYWWANEDEKFAGCKYKKLGVFDLTPCEQEDINAYDNEPDEPEDYDKDE